MMYDLDELTINQVIAVAVVFAVGRELAGAVGIRKRRVDRLFCRLFEHQWADEERYGVEPVCLHCGTRR